jgi:hypothetical protein
MHMRPHFPVVFTLLAVLSAGRLLANDPPNPAEAKLREALRATMIQARDASAQVATLQAAQAELEQKNKDLTARIEKLIKENTTERDAAKKVKEELDATVAKRDAEIVQLKAALEEWKTAQKKAAAFANAADAERQRLAALSIALQRRVNEQQTKNAAMFKIGNEILTRYEKFSFGSALAAREPFVGITRVKLQGLFQDYSDQLVDSRIKPADAQTLRAEAGLPPAKTAPREKPPGKEPAKAASQRPKD